MNREEMMRKLAQISRKSEYGNLKDEVVETWFVYSAPPLDAGWELLMPTCYRTQDGKVLPRFEALFRAAMELGWEGDFGQHEPKIIPSYPSETGFGVTGYCWKQGNNGTTFIALASEFKDKWSIDVEGPVVVRLSSSRHIEPKK